MSISDLIVEHLGLWWTEKSRGKLQQQCSVEEYSAIAEICQFAIDSDCWNGKCYSTACDQVFDELRIQFPELDEKAIKKVGKMAAFQHRE